MDAFAPAIKKKATREPKERHENYVRQLGKDIQLRPDAGVFVALISRGRQMVLDDAGIF